MSLAVLNIWYVILIYIYVVYRAVQTAKHVKTLLLCPTEIGDFYTTHFSLFERGLIRS